MRKQQFTLKERDVETGLDYFSARYFSSTQGRFISPDPLLSSGEVEQPQSWNRYSYTLNNPLVYTDPLGLYVFDKSVDPDRQQQFDAALAQARKNLAKIAQTYGANSKEYLAAQRAVDVYGQKGVANGVTIAANGNVKVGQAKVDGVAGAITKDNPTGQAIRLEFNPSEFAARGFDQLVGHEGSHAADGAEWVASGFAESKRPNEYATEVAAYTVQSLLIEADVPNARGHSYILPGASAGIGKNPYIPEPITLYSVAWKEADKATLRRSNIDALLARPKNRGGDYGLTPATTTKAWRKGYQYP